MVHNHGHNQEEVSGDRDEEDDCSKACLETGDRYIHSFE